MGKLSEIGVHVVEADLNDAVTVRKILETCEVTTVVHLAAQAGVRYAVKKSGGVRALQRRRVRDADGRDRSHENACQKSSSPRRRACTG